MDEDLLGVLIVLGILGVGIIGAVILLILYAEPVRKLLRFRKEEGEEEETTDVETPAPTRNKTVKRTHIVVAQGKNVFEIDEVNKSVRKVTTPARRLIVAVHPLPPGAEPRSLPNSPLKKEAPITLDGDNHSKVERTLSAPAYEQMDNASSASGSGGEGLRKGILRRPLVPNDPNKLSPNRKATVLIINEGNRYRKVTPNTPSLPTSPEMESTYLPGFRPATDRRSSCS